MALIYKEGSFPAHYRQEQVGQIMSALYRLRSIAISGLAGMGKSNVVRFMVSHPQVRTRYLKERADDFLFLHVDCAGLVTSDEAEILDEVAAQLHRAQGTRGAPEPAFSRRVRQALKEQILALPAALNLVVVLDYFDEAAARLDRAFFNYLVYLRNVRPRGNLAYVLVTRRPLGHLHELQDLMDDGCFVGPLGRRDALEALRRDEARLGCTFDADQRERLIACTGGHPGLMKNASELLGGGKLDARRPAEELARQLLASEKIVRLCEDLWGDLTPDEQRLLFYAAQGTPGPEPVDEATVAYLKQSGMLVERANGRGPGNLAVFCPLFETFVRAQAADAAAGAGAIRITAALPNQAHIQTPTGEERVTLSPRLFALLLALAEAPGQVYSTDVLIAQVYGDEALGVTNAALSQLVKRLRGVLNPPAQRLTGDPAHNCVETIREVGYRLNA